MKPTICPTVTARTAEEYREQMERLTPFVHRVHIDVADGLFTPVKSAPIDGIWWPGGVRADLHVMYQKPFAHTKLYLSLAPQMVIVHAEAEGDFVAFANLMQQHGIEVGVALKQETLVDAIVPALDFIDHVLVFSGDLGRFGGQASLGLLSKVAEIKRLQPRIEVGWDGGINNQNARALADGGVDVLNVGGFIQHAADPAAAYQTLAEAVK